MGTPGTAEAASAKWPAGTPVPFGAEAPSGRVIAGRWVIIGAAVWSVGLVAAAMLSAHRDSPTVREQRTIAQAVPVVDRAVGELVAAGQGSRAVLEVSPRRFADGCRLTPNWDGVELERSLIISTEGEVAPAVLDQVARRLPASYRAGVRRDDSGRAIRLSADAGQFVGITGTVTAPGVVTLTARTGCRPPSSGVGPDAAVMPANTPQPRVVLSDLGASSIRSGEVSVVPCPAGRGKAVTARADGRALLGPTQRETLSRPRGTVVVIDSATQFAALTDGRTLDVRVDGDRLDVVTTQVCAGS